MARIITAGAEMGAADGVLNDGSKSGSGTLTFDTGTKYGLGARSYKFSSGAGNATVLLTWAPTAAALGTNTYFRGRIRFESAFPANGSQLMYAYSSTGVAVAYYLMFKSSDSSIDIKDGADAVKGNTGTILVDTWYRLEVRCKISAGAADELEFRIDDRVVCNLSGLNLANTGHIDELDVGWTFGAPGANKVVFWDDVAYNDDTGSNENTWCGDGQVVMLLPTSDSAIGSWTGGAGGTSNLFDAVDNVPPAGVSSASDTNTSQIKTATDGTTATFNCRSYATAGIGPSDLIAVIQSVVVHGEEVATGAKTGTVGAVTNPSIAGTAVTFGITSGAEGTYPSAWGTTRGTPTYAPTVTVGTQPTVSVVSTTMVSRFASVCFMGILLDVVLFPPSQHRPGRTVTNTLLRM